MYKQIAGTYLNGHNNNDSGKKEIEALPKNKKDKFNSDVELYVVCTGAVAAVYMSRRHTSWAVYAALIDTDSNITVLAALLLLPAVKYHKHEKYEARHEKQ